MGNSKKANWLERNRVKIYKIVKILSILFFKVLKS